MQRSLSSPAVPNDLTAPPAGIERANTSASLPTSPNCPPVDLGENQHIAQFAIEQNYSDVPGHKSGCGVQRFFIGNHPDSNSSSNQPLHFQLDSHIAKLNQLQEQERKQQQDALSQSEYVSAFSRPQSLRPTASHHTPLTDNPSPQARPASLPLDEISERSPLVPRRPKPKTVHFGQSFKHKVNLDGPPGNLPPPAVEAVLSRPDELSIPAGEGRLYPPKPAQLSHGKVERIDRILVRKGWTKREDMPYALDEKNIRSYKVLFREWEEMAVTIKPGRLEFWSHYKMPLRERVSKHLKLEYVIPLKEERTTVSLFSKDNTICICSPPYHLKSAAYRHRFAAQAKELIGFRQSGTNIYLLQCRSASIAADYLYSLFHDLGGEIPSSLQVNLPGIGASINFELLHNPTEDEVVNESKVVETSLSQLKSEDWQALRDHFRQQGIEFHLAICSGKSMKWFHEEFDVNGIRRDWAVASAVSLQQASSPHVLELRPAIHLATSVDTRQGVLMEPPAIEGFLDRIAPSGRRKHSYFFTMNGFLFITQASRAHPPSIPIDQVETAPNTPKHAALVQGATSMAAESGLHGGPYSISAREKSHKQSWLTLHRWLALKTSKARSREISSRMSEDSTTADVIKEHRQMERDRLRTQIRNAQGYIDLRQIKTLKMASEVDESKKVIKKRQRKSSSGSSQSSPTAAGDDKAMRTLVIETLSRATFRIEASSTAIAHEWLSRLNEISNYWHHRERQDAKDQVSLHPENAILDYRKQFELPDNPRSAHNENHLWREYQERKNGIEDYSPLLAGFFHQCILDNCRGMVHHGRLFIKNGAKGTFADQFHVLIEGMIIHYQLVWRDRKGNIKPVSYHKVSGTTKLQDAYILTGKLCEPFRGRSRTTNFNPATGKSDFARLYRDGLIATDDEVDCTFALQLQTKSGTGRGLGKGKVLVFRARSELERDVWVMAINSQLEKRVRSDRSREERLVKFPGIS